MKQIWPYIYGAMFVLFLVLCVKGTPLLWVCFTAALGLVLLFDKEKSDPNDHPMKPL